MKKLTTFFILAVLFISGLFAQAKIPYEGLRDDVEPFLFLSPDGLYSYKIRGTISAYDKVKLSFIRFNLSTDTNVSISITFDNKDIYDKFTKDFDLSEIESEFNNLQKNVIKSGIEPQYAQIQNPYSNIAESTNIDPRKPYNTWYNCYCSPKLQLSNAK